MSGVPVVVSDIHDIDIAKARLPETYQAARTALAECQRIDECKDWSDKAQAIAAYARMSKDDALHKMAVRIQARAVRRVGELLVEFDARGGDRTKKDTSGRFGRIAAATNAGLGERQRKTAVRVAKVPKEEFEAAVEADDPMTAAQIAEINKAVPDGFQEATHLLGTLRRFADFCDNNPPHLVAGGLQPQESLHARDMSRRITNWLVDFSALAEGNADE